MRKFTKTEFESLPALVGRSEFQAWTGLGDRELKLLIENKQIEVHYWAGKTKHGYAKYYKRDIARLLGLTM